MRPPAWIGQGDLRSLAFWAGLGALMALGQAPFQVSLAFVVGLVGAVWGFAAVPRAGRALRVGWALGMGYFGLCMTWIVEPFLVDVETHGWMAPFALALMAAGGGAFWALAFGAAHRLRAGLAGLVLCWAGVEALRAFVLTGFPWVDFAQAVMDTPLAWALPLVGPRGVTLAVLALAALAAGALVRAPRVAALAVLLGGAALWALPGPGARPALEGAPVVRLVQPNAPQDQKWDPAHIPTFFARQIAATAATPRPDFVVWPEMAVAYDLDRATPELQQIALAARGAPVVLGLPRFDGARVFNSMIVVGADGAVLDLYDKQHLVPFGEYIPFGSVLGRLGLHGLAVEEGGGYSAGSGPKVLRLPGLGSVLPLICYEAIFAEELRPPARPAAMILITNDAWFGTRTGPYQHLMQARMRALELGLPMVRVANTGISAMIDAHGVVQARLELGQEGWRDSPLPSAKNATFYALYGEIPAGVGLLLGALWVVLRRRAKAVDATQAPA